jgi:hypothetical protein
MLTRKTPSRGHTHAYEAYCLRCDHTHAYEDYCLPWRSHTCSCVYLTTLLAMIVVLDAVVRVQD